ncbi:11783_t:CDS:10 [Entrophospora sp. SA101]|nr:11783_t:CDS:10 [Entrophospora sp. SA101]
MSKQEQQDVILNSDTNNGNITNDTTTTDTNHADKNFYNRVINSRYFTPKFLISIALGQFLSFCITATMVTSNELFVNYNISVPTFQTFLTYVALNLIYTPLTIYKKGFRYWLDIFNLKDYRFLKFEGNYFVVKAYAFTSVLSVMLLGTWAIPVCMLSSIVFLKVGYHWSQYFGVLICLVGIGVLLAGDLDSGQDFSGAVNMGLGDAFCIIGATLYGASNVIEELLVRQRSVYEVVGQLGFWGMIISGIQFLILERQELSAVEWNGSSVGMLLAYTISMVFFYTGAPILFKLSSATFFNLSLQTIHFYSLIFSLLLFGAQMHHLYPVSFVSTIIGLCLFHYNPESRPSYSHPAFPSIGRDCSDVKEKIVSDILDLYSCKPSEEKFNHYSNDVIFEDPLMYCTGIKNIKAQFYGMPKLFTNSVTETLEVQQNDSNILKFSFNQCYTLPLLKKNKVQNSVVILEFNNDNDGQGKKIKKHSDLWDGKPLPVNGGVIRKTLAKLVSTCIKIPEKVNRKS